jgi:hypothetical protein
LVLLLSILFCAVYLQDKKSFSFFTFRIRVNMGMGECCGQKLFSSGNNERISNGIRVHLHGLFSESME